MSPGSRQATRALLERGVSSVPESIDQIFAASGEDDVKMTQPGMVTTIAVPLPVRRCAVEAVNGGS
jgi:hypothetical protein